MNSFIPPGDERGKEQPKVDSAVANKNPIVIPPTPQGVFQVIPYAHTANPTTDPDVKLRRPGVIVPARTRWSYDAPGILFYIIRPEPLCDIESQVVAVEFGGGNAAVACINYPVEEDEWELFVGYGLDDPTSEPVDGQEVTEPLSRGPVRLRIATTRIPGHLPDEDDHPSPLWPEPFHGGHPEKCGKPIFQARKPREFFLTLPHFSEEMVAHDVALFTIAPIIFSCDIDTPCELYAVYTPPYEDEARYRPGNFDVIGALANIASTLGIACVLSATDPYDSDQWAQDAYYMGYTHTPDPDYPVLYYPLKALRKRELSHQKLKTLDGHPLEELRHPKFKASSDNTLDYGGNLVASPPALSATDALGQGVAGPACLAHAAAPYGKIIFCDNGGNRRPSDLFLKFISSQIQPLVPIDVSWLKVGHSDEVVSFVPAPKTCAVTQAGAKGWAMLYPSPDLALSIYCRILERKTEVTRAPRCINFYAPFGAVWHKGVLSMIEAHVAKALVTTDSAKLSREISYMPKLDAIELRLRHVLNMAASDIIHLPVLFNLMDKDVDAVLPNVVNLQVLGTFLAVPKPWGPRVRVKDCIEILVGLEGITLEMLKALDWGSLQRESLWVPQYHTVEAYFDEGCKCAASEPAWKGLPVLGSKPIKVPQGWQHFTISHESVDILEAYIMARLVPLGLTPVFIDDWNGYHKDVGDLHCGTKVLRRMPVIKTGDEWWKHAT